MGFTQIKTDKEIGEAIVETVAFFDLFVYPLTDFELWQYSKIKCSLADIKNILFTAKILETEDGFYYLVGRSEIIETRRKRYNYSDKKFKRARLVARFFKIIPWIKMIAVSNIIGTHNLKEQSDIDLFIITEKKRVWLTRFFCAGFMKILGLRPKEGEEKDKICLNFYVSEGGMDLRRLMLGDNNISKDNLDRNKNRELEIRNWKFDSDIYFIYWLVGLVPIYDSGGMYERFIAVNNWLKEYLPNWQPVKMVKRRKACQGLPKIYHDIVDLLLGGLEQNVKKWQLKKMPTSLRNIMNKDTRVIVNDEVLKLHIKDRREEYRKKYLQKVNELLIT
jgi:hypothetical protein